MLRQTSGHGFSRNSISPKRRLVVIVSYTLTSLSEHLEKREVSKKNTKNCALSYNPLTGHGNANTLPTSQIHKTLSGVSTSRLGGSGESAN
jgi:hypothetical protein